MDLLLRYLAFLQGTHCPHLLRSVRPHFRQSFDMSLCVFFASEDEKTLCHRSHRVRGHPDL